MLINKGYCEVMKCAEYFNILSIDRVNIHRIYSCDRFLRCLSLSNKKNVDSIMLFSKYEIMT